MDVKDSQYRDDERESESSEADVGLISGIHRRAPVKRLWATAKLGIPLLLLSLTLNIVQTVYIAVHKPQCLSLYAKLPENEITVTNYYSTDYGSLNEDKEAMDALWNAIDISEGYVALSHEESDALGLPRSQTFPWDVNKGMYITHGHHALHCTVLLHAFTYDMHRKNSSLVSYHHIEHCLDLLRQDIICHADDHLDFTADHGDQFLTGDGQPRKCRDWNKLSEWVKPRSSCYKTINITRAGEDHGVEHQLDRYTYCPEDSPYQPLIRAWKDLGRPNAGNLEEGVAEFLSEAEKNAEDVAVAEHNDAIMN